MLYLMAPADAQQSRITARFLQRMIGRVDITLSGGSDACLMCSKIVADVLGSSALDTPGLNTSSSAETANKDIAFIAGDAEEILLVIESPLLDALVETRIGCRIDWKPGKVAAVGGDLLHWVLGPHELLDDEQDAVLEAMSKLGDTLIENLGEAKGEYYYELALMKRWLLGDGGRSGNCDLCVENADEGWIPEESTFPNADDAPGHPNCTCSVEHKERRVRHYYDDDEDDDFPRFRK